MSLTLSFCIRSERSLGEISELWPLDRVTESGSSVSYVKGTRSEFLISESTEPFQEHPDYEPAFGIEYNVSITIFLESDTRTLTNVTVFGGLANFVNSLGDSGYFLDGDRPVCYWIDRKVVINNRDDYYRKALMESFVDLGFEPELQYLEY